MQLHYLQPPYMQPPAPDPLVADDLRRGADGRGVGDVAGDGCADLVDLVDLMDLVGPSHAGGPSDDGLTTSGFDDPPCNGSPCSGSFEHT